MTEEDAATYFDLEQQSPFMLLVADVHPDKRATVPAITHIDGSARVQTINKDQEPKVYDLVKHFEARTGVPVLLNTSFNRRGEPIVETPENALEAFVNMNLDALVMGNKVLVKKPQASGGQEQTKSRADL